MGQFVSVRYMKDLNKAVNHVKYIAYRDRSSGRNYGLFGEKADSVPVKDFVKTLKDKRTSHHTSAKIHTLMFTMSGDEWNRGNYMDGDYQSMIRNIMKDWQLERGITVEWVCALHDEKGHPHAHVVIKSVMKDSDGVERKLNINVKEEREWFREAWKHEKERVVGVRGGRPPLTRERSDLERARKKPRLAKDLLNNLNYQVNKMLEEEERKQHLARDYGIER